MKILVKKPTSQETEKMKSMPIWTCDISEFDWHYDTEETCLIIEGEVEIKCDAGDVSFAAGDYVVFPKGLSCVWKVKQPVKKHYIFK
jgi:uncharacterized cupin superfamily protein